MIKICTKCNIEKDVKSFRKFSRNNKEYRYNYCNSCDRNMSKAKGAEKKAAKERAYYRKKVEKYPEREIIHNCNRSDKKYFGKVNDLDQIFVKEIMQKKCTYCGSDNDLITLDRIDNSEPHNKENVLPACYRCNMLRGAMPYEAWMILVPSIKEVFEAGDFENWKFKPKCVNTQKVE